MHLAAGYGHVHALQQLLNGSARPGSSNCSAILPHCYTIAATAKATRPCTGLQAEAKASVCSCCWQQALVCTQLVKRAQQLCT
jgi:hypothetical protein